MINRWSPSVLAALQDGEMTSTDLAKKVTFMTSEEMYLLPGSMSRTAKMLLQYGFVVMRRTSHGKVYRLAPRGEEMLEKLMRLSEAYSRVESSAESSN